MSLTVRAAPRLHHTWLVQKTGCALTSDFTAIEAVDETGRIRGMVGYCNTTPTAIQLHMAVEAPIVWRRLLRPALEHAFVGAGKDICLGIIPEDNNKSCAFVRSVGFYEVGRITDGWAKGDDLIIFQLRREDCRFTLSTDAWSHRRAA